MPVIEVNKKAFLKALNKSESMSNREIEDMCGEFGIEVDKFNDEDGTMKLEIAANRYDLCGFEGIVRAFRVFFGLSESPVYRVAPPRPEFRVTVEPDVARVRPFVVSAILRGITFTPELYESFIGLQEKLHENACRRRALVAIGTHDLDVIQAPFFYRARQPASIEFEPLHVGGINLGKMRADKILEHYADPKVNSHLRPFVPLIQQSPVYPLVCDSHPDNVGVISLPPIINSERSKIRPQRMDESGHLVDPGTRNVFVDCTATDLTRAKIVLNTLVTNFYPHCTGGAEQVEIVTPGQPTLVTPQLDCWELETSSDYMTRAIGVPLDTATVVGYLNRMQHHARAVQKGGKEVIMVQVPPTRSDVMHECDLMEDVAIAYGFKNIIPKVPDMQTVGGVLPDREMTELVRQEIACAGFTEVATFALISEAENFAFLQRPDDGSACTIANPKTKDFEVCRTCLLPCLLRTISSNMAHPKPLRLFEVSEVVLKDAVMDTGARNELRMCAIHCAATPGFEVVHGLLDCLLSKFGIRATVAPPPVVLEEDEEKLVVGTRGIEMKTTYKLVPCGDNAYIEGHRAAIVLTATRTQTIVQAVGDKLQRVPVSSESKEELLGTIGVVHPRVLERFEVSEPCAAFEIQIGKLYPVPQSLI